MHPVVCLLVLLALGAPARAASAHTDVDPDEGTLSSVRPRIPEPMVFDLVRPLGARRGELEVNSLFRLSPGEQPRLLHWAPEVEYTFANGHGVELEVPIEGRRVASVKAALQGTLPGPRPRVFIHGWQGIWEGARGGGAQVDVLYLAGARWHPRWSTFTMTGVRRERHGPEKHVLLQNTTLFYHAGKETSLGLETNLAGDGAGRHRLMLMPQVHTRKSRYNVQGGAGVVHHAGRLRLQIAWRVSREF